MAVAEVPYRWRREHYHRAIEAGFFPGKCWLRHGEVVERVAAKDPRHSACVMALNELLVRGLPDACAVRVEQPWAADDWHEPEPDVAVVARGPYRTDHPGVAETIALIEVCNTTRSKDEVQIREYGTYGVPEAWLIDLNRRTIEIFTGPGDTGYAQSRLVAADESVSVGGVTFALDDIAPAA